MNLLRQEKALIALEQNKYGAVTVKKMATPNGVEYLVFKTAKGKTLYGGPRFKHGELFGALELDKEYFCWELLNDEN